MKEDYNTELKREVTKKFVKTACAYANYNGGKVIFGLNDDETVVGIKDASDEVLKIEHMINDSILPVPIYKIEIIKLNDVDIISLIIEKGNDTPYLYSGKAYRRSDTSTVEVDRFELRRLAMEGMNIDYESKKSSSQTLSFNTLESFMKEETGIEKLNLDILKTLNLYSKYGDYNIAAELLADTNNYMFSGVDIARFGKDINKIMYRETISEKSLLLQYKRALEIFEQYYTFEEIVGYKREKKEIIPKEAFRESLANAIVHRLWDINSYIQIGMYDKKIEISSPGGLPPGIKEEEYLYGQISVLRNPIISGVFDRLNIIEKFGTGIARIKNEYNESRTKPEFFLTDNRIKIVLPVIDKSKLQLYKNEGIIYDLLKDEDELSRKEIDDKTGFEKTKTIRTLNKLIKKKVVKKEGDGVAVTYKLN